MVRIVVFAVVLAFVSCPRLAPRPVIVSPHLSAVAAAAAFQQGIEAALVGLPISACPFVGDDAARAWRAGWQWANGRG